MHLRVTRLAPIIKATSQLAHVSNSPYSRAVLSFTPEEQKRKRQLFFLQPAEPFFSVEKRSTCKHSGKEKLPLNEQKGSLGNE